MGNTVFGKEDTQDERLAEPRGSAVPDKIVLFERTSSIQRNQGILDQEHHDEVPINLHHDDLNPKCTNIDYAVRGPIVARAVALQTELASDPEKVPFEELIFCNIGNPQALGQKPVTFFRQVLAGLLCPEIAGNFPEDVHDRISWVLEGAAGRSIGSYTASQGILRIRVSLAKFLGDRDDVESDPNNIFMTNGASEGVKSILDVLMFKPNHGLLCPIPQYPLYTASMGIVGGTVVPYYLNEEKGWSVDVDDLPDIIAKATEQGTEVRAIVVINPGNPSGSLLSEADVEGIIRIAAKHELTILSDEVYQENVFEDGAKFVSFRRVWGKLVKEDPETFGSLRIISFHSTSKGFTGECGLRGGFFELLNCNDAFRSTLVKLKSTGLCPNTIGQVLTELMVNPPKPGMPSYDLYLEESTALKRSLRDRAQILCEGLNAISGISCQVIQGALYAFPQIEIPSSFYKVIPDKGVAPDEYFCMQLLEATGIVVVPGSGFRQKNDTWHIRLTILPPKDQIDYVLSSFAKFYAKFISDITVEPDKGTDV